MKIKRKLKKKSKDEGKKQKLGKENREVKIMIWIMISVIALFILINFIIKGINKFEYLGLEFEEEKIGNITFYYTKMQIKRATGDIVNYNLYLRNDPRKLEDIPAIEINFKKDYVTYIATSPEVGACGHANLGLVNLGSFLKGVGISAKGATTDESVAREHNATFVNCDNTKNTVIILRQGKINKIFENKPDCYVAEISNCNEILRVTERIITAVIEQSRV